MKCACNGSGWIELPPVDQGSWDLVACVCNEDQKLPAPLANWE